VTCPSSTTRLTAVGSPSTSIRPGAPLSHTGVDANADRLAREHLGEAHLHAVLAEYQEHHNTARPHQGIAQRIPAGDPDTFHGFAADLDFRRIRRKPVLNGLINEYLRAA
jgi:hypothetical protein